MIVRALKSVGAARSIVIDERGKILAGNGVADAAAEAGISKLRVVEANGDEIIAVRRRGLSAKQKRDLAIYDNRTTDLSEWDLDQLRLDHANGADLSAFFTETELGDMLTIEANGGRTDPDQVPEPRTRSTVHVGDVYKLGAHRLICGDATDADVVARVANGSPLDFVVTSPPYNVDMKYRTHVDKSTRDEYLSFIEATARAFLPQLAAGRFVAWNIGVSPKTYPAHQVVRLEACGLQFYRQIVWTKSGIPYPVFPYTLRTKRARYFTPNFTHEVIQVFEHGDEKAPKAIACTLCDGSGKMAARELPIAEGHETVQLLAYNKPEVGEATVPDKRYQNDVWQIAQSQATVDLKTVGKKRVGTGLKHKGQSAHIQKEHPAAYPVELPRALMTFLTAPGERVLDPFGGSGTTLIACEQMKRAARLIEIDPVYCQIVIDRWEAFTGKRAVKIGTALPRKQQSA